MRGSGLPRYGRAQHRRLLQRHPWQSVEEGLIPTVACATASQKQCLLWKIRTALLLRSSGTRFLNGPLAPPTNHAFVWLHHAADPLFEEPHVLMRPRTDLRKPRESNPTGPPSGSHDPCGWFGRLAKPPTWAVWAHRTRTRRNRGSHFDKNSACRRRLKTVN